MEVFDIELVTYEMEWWWGFDNQTCRLMPKLDIIIRRYKFWVRLNDFLFKKNKERSMVVAIFRLNWFPIEEELYIKISTQKNI